MNSSSSEDASEPVPAADVVVTAGLPVTEPDEAEAEGTISEPAKVMRIGSMIKQLLEEVRQAPLDDRSRVRLKAVFERSIVELGSALSSDLREELAALALPFADDEVPSDAELRIAQAQLVGWLEGLFHGIQAMLFAQQAQMEQMRQQRGLPQGQPGMGHGPGDQRGSSGPPNAGGTYL